MLITDNITLKYKNQEITWGCYQFSCFEEFEVFLWKYGIDYNKLNTKQKEYIDYTKKCISYAVIRKVKNPKDYESAYKYIERHMGTKPVNDKVIVEWKE